MNRDKLIRELRRYARKNGLFFELDKRRGKGGHYIVTVGDKSTTLQSDLNESRAASIRKQLGIA